MPTLDYQRIEKAIYYLSAHRQEQPSLTQVAEVVGLSDFHFQRLFQHWAGVSPKRFLQVLTVEHAKDLLRRNKSVLETSFEVGLSGPSRLHDLCLSIERMTPGEYQKQARHLEIFWDIVSTPLGPMLLAAMERGLCSALFVAEGDEQAAYRDLQERWPLAKFTRTSKHLAPYGKALSDRIEKGAGRSLGVMLKGTPFQLKVWEALLRLPSGEVTTYSDIANHIGQKKAARAVGSAVGKNPLAFLIPCHRVIRSTGVLGDYRWGSERKALLLGREWSLNETSN